jgi:hypothetical protein
VGETALHVAADVGAVRALWDRSGLLAGAAIAAQLSAFAEALAVAHAARQRGAAVLLSNWSNPRDEPHSAGSLEPGYARLIVSRDHGFVSWAAVTGDCDPAFELAVDAVVLGRIDELRRLLAETPDLVARRSAYGHRATLLHYTAANGVEIRRQVVPANAAEIAAALLEAGADPAARLHAYGRTFDTLAMLKSSTHPRAAGVEADIEHALATYLNARDA